MKKVPLIGLCCLTLTMIIDVKGSAQMSVDDLSRELTNIQVILQYVN